VADVPVLRLDGVWRGFDRGHDRVLVLGGVSLTVPAGALVAVLGERSQGKTTLIRVASGTLPAQDGQVLIDGQHTLGLSDRELSEMLARKVGLATRKGPDAKINVQSYLEMRLIATREHPRRSRKAILTRALHDLDLTGAEMWSELSDSQRVTVELAQAAITKPRLLLVDDILDGLPRDAKHAALQTLEELAKDHGCAILMAVSDHTTATRGDQVHHLTRGTLRPMHQPPNIINLDASRQRAG